ncbi:hypothetical protein HPB52_015422 [Rhipicephalus sanguineus]|uniref:Uncharacterized protein n=1 Tax=Rhipicephalus sanguineus TaxID=34632 RepID=A0A9D4SZ13_RHISA|nr:hypothetical protein HPB52_015422 [Rhipicephalus sanguineus]
MLSTLQLVCLVAFGMYLLYYYTCVVRKPWVICGSTNMRTFLRVNCGSLVEEPFWPPIWCIGSNFQCLVSLIVQVGRFTLHSTYREDATVYVEGAGNDFIAVLSQ